MERGAKVYFSPATRGKRAAQSENQSKTQYNDPGAEPPAQGKMGTAGGLCNGGQLFSDGDHSSLKHANCMHNSYRQHSPILQPCNTSEVMLLSWKVVPRAFLGCAVADRGVR